MRMPCCTFNGQMRKSLEYVWGMQEGLSEVVGYVLDAPHLKYV